MRRPTTGTRSRINSSDESACNAARAGWRHPPTQEVLEAWTAACGACRLSIRRPMRAATFQAPFRRGNSRKNPSRQMNATSTTSLKPHFTAVLSFPMWSTSAITAFEFARAVLMGQADLSEVGDAVLLMRSDAFIDSSNVAARRLFGCRADAMSTAQLTKIVISAHREGFAAVLAPPAAPICAVRPTAACRLTGLRTDGRSFPMEVRLGRLHLRSRTLVTTIGGSTAGESARSMEVLGLRGDLMHAGRLVSSGRNDLQLRPRGWSKVSATSRTA